MRVQTLVAILLFAIVRPTSLPAQVKPDDKPKENPTMSGSALEVLDASPSLTIAEEFNPVALVRAVNHLQSLGKEKALSDLRAFLTPKVEAAKKESDPWILEARTEKAHLIIRLLFEPDDPKRERPNLRIMNFVWEPDPKDLSLWPCFPLSLQQVLPFLIPWSAIVAPQFEGASLDEHIEWAVKYGKFRRKPLRPTDDPFAAADKFLERLKVKGLKDGWGRAREQAWVAVADIVRQNAKLPPDFPKMRSYTLQLKVLDLSEDADWDRLKKIASTLKIRWSEKEQKYAIEK
jgi:hypothetical protein